jgi:copper chaperone CopZ
MKLVNALSVILCAAAAAWAETKVVIEQTHMCCKACVTGAQKAAKSVAGAAVEASQSDKTITVTAPDVKTAQAAVDALVAGGYFGTIPSGPVQIANPVNLPKGKVSSLTLTGFHNCCKSCANGLNKAVASVEGAKSGLESKQMVMSITGSFDAQQVVAAIQKAGYAVRVKSPE